MRPPFAFAHLQGNRRLAACDDTGRARHRVAGAFGLAQKGGQFESRLARLALQVDPQKIRVESLRPGLRQGGLGSQQAAAHNDVLDFRKEGIARLERFRGLLQRGRNKAPTERGQT